VSQVLENPAHSRCCFTRPAVCKSKVFLCFLDVQNAFGTHTYSDWSRPAYLSDGNYAACPWPLSRASDFSSASEMAGPKCPSLSLRARCRACLRSAYSAILSYSLIS